MTTLGRAVEGGTVLEVWVQPRGSKTAVVGRQERALRIRVAAPPVDGAANQELVRFLAKRLGVPRSAVAILRGLKRRRKSVRIEGLDPHEVLTGLGL